LDILTARDAALCGDEDPRTNPETDIVRALYDLWCGGRGSLRVAYRCLAHRATPRPETLRRRGCGCETWQTVTAGGISLVPAGRRFPRTANYGDLLGQKQPSALSSAFASAESAWLTSPRRLARRSSDFKCFCSSSLHFSFTALASALPRCCFQTCWAVRSSLRQAASLAARGGPHYAAEITFSSSCAG
jgi:hypothetical protein